jgi:hypothetical protein
MDKEEGMKEEEQGGGEATLPQDPPTGTVTP